MSPKRNSENEKAGMMVFGSLCHTTPGAAGRHFPLLIQADLRTGAKKMSNLQRLTILSSLSLFVLAFTVEPQTNQVSKNPDRARYALRELSKPGIRSENIEALAVGSH